MQRIVYLYPRVTKLDFGGFGWFGPGLGNMLFPWARAVIRQNKTGGRLLWPAWRRLLGGNGLRDSLQLHTSGVQDHRLYWGCFRPNKNYLTGWQRAVARRSPAQITEKEVVKEEATLVTFEGVANSFTDLAGAEDIIRRELRDITHPQVWQHVPKADLRYIAMHVRLGDFLGLELQKPGKPLSNARLPLVWYSDILKDLRTKSSLPVLICSDGSDEELAPLFSIPNVKRYAEFNPLATLWTLAQAEILFCSISSFSAWGALLSGKPSIWYPGTSYGIALSHCRGVNAITRSPDELLPDYLFRG